MARATASANRKGISGSDSAQPPKRATSEVAAASPIPRSLIGTSKPSLCDAMQDADIHNIGNTSDRQIAPRRLSLMQTLPDLPHQRPQEILSHAAPAGLDIGAYLHARR